MHTKMSSFLRMFIATLIIHILLHYCCTDTLNIIKPSKLFAKLTGYRTIGQVIAAVKVASECAVICTHHTSCLSYNVIQGSDGLRCEVSSDAGYLAVDSASAYYG